MHQVTHRLKTHPAAFYAVRDGRKPFEVRKNDRLYQTGDLVVLEYWDPDFPGEEHLAASNKNELITPAKLTRKIGWILGGGQYGIEPGHVVFALENIDDSPTRLERVTDMLERIRAYGAEVCKEINKDTVTLTDNQIGALGYLQRAVENAAKVLVTNEITAEQEEI